MKKIMFSIILFGGLSTVNNAIGQDLKEKDVPAAVKTAFAKKYPEAKKISWEKEKGNYEANWGGRSGKTYQCYIDFGAPLLLFNAFVLA